MMDHGLDLAVLGKRQRKAYVAEKIDAFLLGMWAFVLLSFVR